MGRRIFLFLIISGLFLPAARAAIWSEGEGQLYVRAVFSNQSLNGVQANRSEIYTEYGLGAEWTLIGKAARLEFEDIPSQRLNGKGWALSLQRSIDLPAGFITSGHLGLIEGKALTSTRGIAVTGGLGAGWSGKLRGRATFLTVSAEHRFHRDHIRSVYMVGQGGHLIGDIWTLNTLFYESGGSLSTSFKTQSELVWHRHNMELALGFREELGGAFQQSELYIAMSVRLGEVASASKI